MTSISPRGVLTRCLPRLAAAVGAAGGPIDQRKHRVGERQHHGCLVAHDPVDLTKQAGEVAHPGEGEHRHDQIDGAGSNERQFGRVVLV